MLIDLHAHSSGISRCCRQDARAIIEKALETGIDGIVLTNHYQECYIEDGRVAEFVEKYIAEYEQAKAVGDELGAKVFFGVEVTLNCDSRLHMLVYGVSADFLRENPLLWALTPEELYKLVSEAGGAVVQAHPYRNGAVPLPSAVIDGVELSCHPVYDGTNVHKLLPYAAQHSLAVTCGGDYHADTPYRAKCGVYLPEETKDTFDIARFIKSAPEMKLSVHEVHTPAPYEITVKIR